MKTACIILTVLILVAIMAVCIMVKFATEITLQEKKREDLGSVFGFSKSMGIVLLNDNSSLTMSQRFPYVAAVTRNSSNTQTFSCFASIILLKWIVTSAHCRRQGALHRVLLYYDFVRNYNHPYPLLFWRVHEKFNRNLSIPKYDIAVAKLNSDYHPHPLAVKSSTFDANRIYSNLDASIWKTVSTMNKKMFLTNDFDRFEVSILPNSRCFESYGVELDESLFCVDLSMYDDCFVHEFGPLYAGDKVVGVLAVKPRDCDVKLAIFTNVSYYASWILKSTRTTYYG